MTTRDDVIMVIRQYLATLEARIAKLETAQASTPPPDSVSPVAASVTPPSVPPIALAPTEPQLKIPTANDPMPENLSKLAGDLKSVGVELSLVTLAEWSTTRHDVIRSWIDQGAKKDARPEFLPAPKPEQVDLLAALRRSVAAAKPAEAKK